MTKGSSQETVWIAGQAAGGEGPVSGLRDGSKCCRRRLAIHTEAVAIDGAGTVYGRALHGTNTLIGYWQGPRFNALPLINVRGVNHQGSVVGAIGEHSVQRPVVWTRGSLLTLPLFAGDTTGDALAINDKNDVVGVSGGHRGFLYSHGRQLELVPGGVAAPAPRAPGPFGISSGAIPRFINDHGDVLGLWFDGEDVHEAIWPHGHKMVLLDDAVKPRGTLLMVIDGINTAGVIACSVRMPADRKVYAAALVPDGQQCPTLAR